MTRIDLPRKSRSRIHAAEGFLPLQAIKGVESVWKIETGLECDRRLPRKLRITVRCDRMGGGERKHSKSQFSQQPLTPFEPRFVFPDRLDMHQCLRRPKIFRRVNCTLRFQSGPSSPLLCMSTVNLCFLSNHWPLSSPVSCFGTNLMPLNTLDCRKYSAARMGVCDFEPTSPTLCTRTVFHKYLDRRRLFSSSVSWFLVRSKSLNAYISWKYSTARFWAVRFESDFANKTVQRKNLEFR